MHLPSEAGALEKAAMAKARSRSRTRGEAFIAVSRIQLQHAITPWIGVSRIPQLVAKRAIRLNHLVNLPLHSGFTLCKRHRASGD